MLDYLETEKSNQKTTNLDELNIYDILRVINQEDATVPLAITENLSKLFQSLIYVFPPSKKWKNHICGRWNKRSGSCYRCC